MATLPLILLVLMAGTQANQYRFTLLLDGKEVGGFSSLERSATASPSPSGQKHGDAARIELQHGWIELAAFAIWLEAADTDTAQLQFSQPDFERRPRATFTILPEIQSDPRAGPRSWSLLEACPAALEVDRIEDSGKVWVRSLILSVGSFAAER